MAWRVSECEETGMVSEEAIILGESGSPSGGFYTLLENVPTVSSECLQALSLRDLPSFSSVMSKRETGNV